MNDQFNIFDSRVTKDSLKQIINYKFDLFEIASEDMIKKLISDLANLSKKIQEKTPNKPFDLNDENIDSITEDDWELIDELGEYHLKHSLISESLYSIYEMRIVYLFKSLEIIMKKLIEKAYPESNTIGFYKWENIKSYFKSKDINLTILPGYPECNDLRKINNAIKHNDELGEEVKKINEFKGAYRFSYNILGEFYKRVKPKIEDFKGALEIEIENDLFSFTPERIDKIVKEYSHRMNKDDLKLFISKLTSRL